MNISIIIYINFTMRRGLIAIYNTIILIVSTLCFLIILINIIIIAINRINT